MQINTLNHFIRPVHYFLILFFTILIYPEANFGQNIKSDFVPGSNYNDPTVSLVYKDTLTLPSLTDFTLAVKMKPGNEVSAISLGFYFPEEYLDITGMKLANGASGFNYSVKDSLFQLVWSDINPIIINENDTILTIEMKTLDLSGLSGTIKLELYEFSEFADESANVIEGVVLEIPEIKYLDPGPVDTVAGIYVKVYPNPFRDYTSINFYLKEESRVKISLTELSGMEISQVADTDFSKGAHQVKIYAVDLSNGIYLLKFEMRNASRSGSRVIKILSMR